MYWWFCKCVEINSRHQSTHINVLVNVWKKEFVATHTCLMPVKTKNKNVHRANADPATTEKNVKHDMENYNAYVASIFPSPFNIVKHKRRKKRNWEKISFFMKIYITCFHWNWEHIFCKEMDAHTDFYVRWAQFDRCYCKKGKLKCAKWTRKCWIFKWAKGGICEYFF